MQSELILHIYVRTILLQIIANSLLALQRLHPFLLVLLIVSFNRFYHRLLYFFIILPMLPCLNTTIVATLLFLPLLCFLLYTLLLTLLVYPYSHNLSRVGLRIQ